MILFIYFFQQTPYGIVNFGNKNKLSVSFGVSFGTYSSSDKWTSYYRNITSAKEKNAIACLLNDIESFDGHVFTWVKLDENNAIVRII